MVQQATTLLDGAESSIGPTAPSAEQAHRLEESRPAPRSDQVNAGVAPTPRDTDVVKNLDAWRAKHRFYHQRMTEYLRFLIPEGQSVLVIGCEDGTLLSALNPTRGVGIDTNAELIACARKRNGQHEYIHTACDDFALTEQFDYVVIDDAVNHTPDVVALIQRVGRLCKPTSRVVVIQPHPGWRSAHRRTWRYGARTPLSQSNRLSAADLGGLLEGVGLETLYVWPKLFCRRQLLGIGQVVNFIAGLLPFMHRFAGVKILVARPESQPVATGDKSATVVLAMRDERENVEPIIRAIPQVGSDTEIIIVEGHSTDGTREEIERVIRAYPDKAIRLIAQKGEGVGNAILEGFQAAKGDIIILLEGDQTSPPEDVGKVFEMIASGRADYVNGSRFIYPRGPKAMPWCNAAGNRAFAAFFGWLLRQRTTDVLCGLKGIDRDQFHCLLARWGFLGLTDPFSDFELILGSARLGLKIREVPTRYTRRGYGRTKIMVFRHGFRLARIAARAARMFHCR